MGRFHGVRTQGRTARDEHYYSEGRTVNTNAGYRIDGHPVVHYHDRGICRELFEMLDSLLEKNMTEWKKQYSVDEILYDSNAERTILIGTMDAVYQKWYPDSESGQLWIDRGEAWSPS